jgi:hypothetical protein
MRSQIRTYLTEKLRTAFPDWDYASEYIDPKAKPKLNIAFPREQLTPFADGPRVYERELLCELELVARIPKDHPFLVEELTETLAVWLEKERFLDKLVLNSQLINIESGEDFLGDQRLGFAVLRVKYLFHNNLRGAA